MYFLAWVGVLYLIGVGGGDREGISGSCGEYQMCIVPDIGGGGSWDPPQESPSENCEQISNVVKNSEVIAKNNVLKSYAKGHIEYGYKIKANGGTSDIIFGEHGSVDLGSQQGYQGTYHIHPIKGFPMFSTQDISNMLNLALYQGNGQHQNAYAGLLAAHECNSCGGGYFYYHYMMQYTGSYQDLNQLVNYTNWDFDKLKEYYRRLMHSLYSNPSYYDYNLGTLNQSGMEKVFFQMLDKMGLTGKVSLKRVDNNGKVSIIEMGGESPKSFPCP